MRENTAEREAAVTTVTSYQKRPATSLVQDWRCSLRCQQGGKGRPGFDPSKMHNMLTKLWADLIPLVIVLAVATSLVEHVLQLLLVGVVLLVWL
jgi:hypothetical protein